jgi:hypothetical protein
MPCCRRNGTPNADSGRLILVPTARAGARRCPYSGVPSASPSEFRPPILAHPARLMIRPMSGVPRTARGSECRAPAGTIDIALSSGSSGHFHCRNRRRIMVATSRASMRRPTTASIAGIQRYGSFGPIGPLMTPRPWNAIKLKGIASSQPVMPVKR